MSAYVASFLARIKMEVSLGVEFIKDYIWVPFIGAVSWLFSIIRKNEEHMDAMHLQITRLEERSSTPEQVKFIMLESLKPLQESIGEIKDMTHSLSDKTAELYTEVEVMKTKMNSEAASKTVLEAIRQQVYCADQNNK